MLVEEGSGVARRALLVSVLRKKQKKKEKKKKKNEDDLYELCTGNRGMGFMGTTFWYIGIGFGDTLGCGQGLSLSPFPFDVSVLLYPVLL